MKTKPKTVADLEAQTGKPDSIRNPKSGKNSRSDKRIDTLKKELLSVLPGLTLPDEMPMQIEIKFKEHSSFATGGRLEKMAAILNAFDLL